MYALRLVEPGFQLFRHATGKGIGHLSVDGTVEPGTYRIVSKLTGTVLQVSEHDCAKIVSWELVEKKESQQWYLQRSGGGYRFRNRKHNDLYLSVASTETHAFVTASRYPATWVLLKVGDHYGIQLADHDQLIDLHFGRSTNGNEIHIWPADGKANKTWALDRINDDTGEPHQGKCAQLDEELANKKDRTDKLEKAFVEEKNRADRLEKTLIHGKDRADRLEKTVTQLQHEVVKKDQQIIQQEDTIRRLQGDLEAREPSHLQAKLSQQQDEIASLQAKIDRLEYLVSQVVNKPDAGGRFTADQIVDEGKYLRIASWVSG
ncbi:unnamed protein product [Rhizoctonia solani]|uniref:Ricin B lectin domain-containing protein n=1 Tax=Rhizoctonia solani TaxID=456999 RepID=A0A8H3GTK7_9AGAM|nr:unnamed protein product [Rhizoctonia solani]